MIRYRIWEELDNHIVKSCILVLVSFFFNLYRYLNSLWGGGVFNEQSQLLRTFLCELSRKTREGPVYPHIHVLKA